jgi:8-amino-7-oxononanoate synthase
VPPTRHRHLRPFAAPTSVHLQPLPSSDPLLDLASNDYLGLSRHPNVVAAAAAELTTSGLGAGASRLISGTRPVHQQLETELAPWLGRERVLLFPSGFQANIAAVGALADRHSLVLADRAIHHSLLVGVRACGARLARFAPNDVADLERRLIAARREAPERPLLVLCESLYSMDADRAPLAAYPTGPWLAVDEAHAIGCLGPRGRGLAAAAGVEPDVLIGTFGKAFGGSGAFVVGPPALRDLLVNEARAFIFSTAPAEPVAAMALAALAAATDDLREQLRANVTHLRRALQQAGFVAPQQAADFGQVGFDVHGAVAAQGGEAAVHFGAHAARAGPRQSVAGPQATIGKALGQVLGNRQRVPHHKALVHQDRHLAQRTDAAQPLLEGRVGFERVKAHHDFLKLDAGLSHQDPRSHGPRRVVFVADVQLQAHGQAVPWRARR